MHVVFTNMHKRVHVYTCTLTHSHTLHIHMHMHAYKKEISRLTRVFIHPSIHVYIRTHVHVGSVSGNLLPASHRESGHVSGCPSWLHRVCIGARESAYASGLTSGAPESGCASGRQRTDCLPTNNPQTKNR